MKKKGFTLVELLAVIAILAILVIIALPNIMSMFNEAKKSTFTTELKNIYRGAEQAYVKDAFKNSGTKVYSKCKSGCTNELDMNVRDDLEYYIEINSSGKIVKLYARDNSYQYKHDGEMTINDIKNIEDISKVSRVLAITPNGFKNSIIPNPCNFNQELVQGTEYINGNYIYRYKQVGTGNSWENVDYEGWGVKYNKNGNVDSINDKICTTINNIPITSTAYMFYNNQTVKSIDLSSLDTSQVKDMTQMFASCYELTNIDFSSFDTSNVENMYGMFSRTGNNVKNFYLDLSSFDTSKVKNMRDMFWFAGDNSETFYLNVSGWNTSNVEDMYGMFEDIGNKAKNFTLVGLDNWNVSNVKNMVLMFTSAGAKAERFSLDLSKWNTQNLENMGQTFESAGKAAKYWSIGDLSNWNTKKVTNMTNLFKNAGTNAEVWNSIGSFDVYANNTKEMFSGCTNAKATLNFYKEPTQYYVYSDIFKNASTIEGSEITVNYSSEVTSIDGIINQKSTNSNIIKGIKLD